MVEALSKAIGSQMVSKACSAAKTGAKRTRMLPPTLTLWLVVLLSVFRRLSCANLLEWVAGSLWLKPRWKRCPSTTALTKARDRLGIEPLRQLFRSLSAEWAMAASKFRVTVNARRVFAMDGATLKVADSLANRVHFGLPGRSRGRTGYPQMRSATLLDVGPRLVVAERHGPYSNAELTLARDLLSEVPVGSVVLLDRGFLAFDFLWAIKNRSCDFIVRMKKGLRRRTVEQRGPADRLVDIRISRHARRKTPDLPETWRLREITFRPKGSREHITIWTTILDPAIPWTDLVAAYCARWEIETVHDEWKTHLSMCTTVNRPVVFRSETPERIEQEWYGLLLAYNAVRQVMCEAASQAGVEPHRLSFTAALERIREAVHDMSRLRTVLLPSRYRELLASIARAVLPSRPGRHNPRVVKVKMSKFRVKQSVAA